MPNWNASSSNCNPKILKNTLCLFLLFISVSLSAQRDSVNYEEVNRMPTDSSEMHSVRRATLLSTFLPGAGQAYNGKYWKMPIVYAGLGACGYFAVENHRLYRQYLDAFLMRIDSTSGNDQFFNIYSERQLIELQNIYRDWRDLSIIIGAAVWALNIIDAHVDAHLYYYNVNEDLSFRLEPAVIPMGGMYNGMQALGLGLKINLDP